MLNHVAVSRQNLMFFAQQSMEHMVLIYIMYGALCEEDAVIVIKRIIFITVVAEFVCVSHGKKVSKPLDSGLYQMATLKI